MTKYPMTVKELIELLAQFDSELLVYTSNFNAETSEFDILPIADEDICIEYVSESNAVFEFFVIDNVSGEKSLLIGYR